MFHIQQNLCSGKTIQEKCNFPDTAINFLGHRDGNRVLSLENKEMLTAFQFLKGILAMNVIFYGNSDEFSA